MNIRVQKNLIVLEKRKKYDTDYAFFDHVKVSIKIANMKIKLIKQVLIAGIKKIISLIKSFKNPLILFLDLLDFFFSSNISFFSFLNIITSEEITIIERFGVKVQATSIKVIFSWIYISISSR